ncbi:hypothetical protein B9Z19DRAFT_1126309 [Tuber borchii]|uniref:Uncharacterized protein n=1 Tax=Tuber borchii TaxID=42251 RepID=A0A2T6ZT79_TUBBO|nr:hypothetical protein B9Z19DRAFT_1126309 [Tuber borchii]
MAVLGSANGHLSSSQSTDTDGLVPETEPYRFAPPTVKNDENNVPLVPETPNEKPHYNNDPFYLDDFEPRNIIVPAPDFRAIDEFGLASKARFKRAEPTVDRAGGPHLPPAADSAATDGLVNDNKCLNEILKTQRSEEEKRAQSFEEGVLGLRRQLAEENERQIAELEEANTIPENSKEDLETRVKRIPTLENEVRLLESRLADLEAASNEKANQDFEALSLQQPSLEERLHFANDQHQTTTSTITHLQQASTTTLATRKLTKEKESPKNDLDKAAREAEASRIHFAQLLHDAKKMFEKNEEVEKLVTEEKKRDNRGVNACEGG